MTGGIRRSGLRGLAHLFLLVSVGGTASAASPATAKPGLLEYWQGPFVVRPTSLSLTATDGIAVTGSGKYGHQKPIKWSEWTGRQSSGTGVIWFDS
jgi:hypothetical protein